MTPILPGALESDPKAVRLLTERRHLMRACAQRVVENHEAGRGVDPETLRWARAFLAANPEPAP